MSFLQLAFSFDGRMRRRDFWLGQILLAFVIGFIAMILLPVSAMMLGLPRPDTHFSPLLIWLIRLLLVWPALAIAVKRGHDRNRPAVWIIGLYASYAAVAFFAPSRSPLWPSLRITEIVFLAYVVVDLGLLDGTTGANRFGTSPKSSESVAEAIA